MAFLVSAIVLPHDADAAALAGRVWSPDRGGPVVVAIRDGHVFDISTTFPTMRDLCETKDPAVMLRQARGIRIGSVSKVLANSWEADRDRVLPYLLAPIDLQAIKAAGVTFAISMLERVIEERARGDADAAAGIRNEIVALVGDDFSKLKPGSPEASHLKKILVDQGAWSQYLEVGIGPDAEIFTKSQIMSAVGCGADAGIASKSTWNNPEPEVVLVVASNGQVVGATLGNDVNLRDVEGRSALLLGEAKDNNASCVIGPFIRFFDAAFTMNDVRRMDVELSVTGAEGYTLTGISSMAKISRDPAELAGQLIGRHHQYPDGAVLFLGTLFAPIDDRDEPGKGFTHKVGDIVRISNPKLGQLANRMRYSEDIAPWTFGVGALIEYLVKAKPV